VQAGKHRPTGKQAGKQVKIMAEGKYRKQTCTMAWSQAGFIARWCTTEDRTAGLAEFAFST